MALPSKQVQTERLAMVMRCYQNALSNAILEYDEMKQGYDLLMGKHYTDEQIAYYKKLKRPTNVWNLFLPVFNHIVGEFIVTKSRMKIYGYWGGTADIAKIYEKICQYIQIQSEYKTTMIKTYVEGLIKRGWSTIEYNNKKELEGSANVYSVPNMEMMVDTRAQELLGMDGQFQIRTKWLDSKDLMNAWPEWKSELKPILMDAEQSRFLSNSDQTMTQWRNSDFMDLVNGQYRVIEFQWRDYRDADVLVNPQNGDREILQLDPVKRKLVQRAMPGWKILSAKNVPVVMKTYVIPALTFFLSEEENEVQDGMFNYFPFSAYGMYSPDFQRQFALTKNGRGPQLDFNDRKNRELDVLNKSASTGVIMKPSAIENYNAIKNRTSQPGIEVLIKAGHNVRDVFERMDPAKLPTAESNQANESFNLFHKILSITENLRGETQTNQENASLYAQRLQQAQKALLPINLCYQKMEDAMWNRGVKLIQRFYNASKVIPIIGGKDVEFLQINVQQGDRIFNDISIGKYAIFPSTEPTNPTIQQAKFLMKQELVNTIVSLFGPQTAAISIDVDWWLEDVDLGDLEGMKSRLKQVQQFMARGMQRQQALAEVQGILGMAGATNQLTGVQASAPQPG